MIFTRIVERMKLYYIADTGLGRIHPYPQTLEDHWVAPNEVKSVQNENGILFLAYMLANGYKAFKYFNLTKEQKKPFRAEIKRAAETVKSLERIPGVKGLYNRQPGGYNQRQERHDNFVGICAISVLNNDETTPQAMIDWAWSHKFCFNNVEPEKFDKHQLRQPGEVALYYVAAGKKPPLLFWIWLLAGIIIGIMKKDAHAPQLRLTWLRIFIIDEKGVKGNLQNKMYQFVRQFWFKKLNKFGGVKEIFQFPDGHPVLLFNKLLP